MAPSENLIAVTMDAPVNLVAEFVEAQNLAQGSSALAAYAGLLVELGYINSIWEIADYDFDRGGPGGTGNGIPDTGEMVLLQWILEDGTFDRTAFGGTSQQRVYADWSQNIAQAALDLPTVNEWLQRAVAGYMTLGTPGHVEFITGVALAQWGVTLDPADYVATPGLAPEDDADGDGAWNRLEWLSVVEEYLIVDPDFDDAVTYAEWAMDPTLPSQVDIGLDLADGDGTNWDYSHLPQGTVTFQSAQDLPIEIRILDPPGREDVPVPIGEPVQIPLGAELLIKLAEGANAAWFYTWIAPGQMIDGSAEKTERFRLMRSGTIQPERRPIGALSLHADITNPQDPYTWEWSGVGPFGHMIAAGSGSAVQVQAPVGAFVKVRAYKIKEPSAGAGANVGNDKQYAKKFNYTINGGSTRRTYSSSPMFTSAAADIEPAFWVYAPEGFLTHSVSSGDGGDAFIDAGSPALIHGDMGGLYRSVTTVKPGPTDYNTYPLCVTCKTVPGKEVAGWNGGYTLAQLPNPVGIGYYTKDSGGAGGSPEIIDMQQLQVDIEVTEQGGAKSSHPDTHVFPPKGGYVVNDPGKAYFSNFGIDYVLIEAVPYTCYEFDKWYGSGDALPDAGGAPDLDPSHALPLNSPSVPVTLNPIWVEMGVNNGANPRKIIAVFEKLGSDLCGFGSGLPLLNPAEFQWMPLTYPNIEYCNVAKEAEHTMPGSGRPNYNCGAWTLGFTDDVWWDLRIDVAGNNNGVFEVADFIAIYTARGINAIIYGNGGSDYTKPPTHVALKLGNQCASSKMGQWYRIRHDIHAFEGSAWGSIVWMSP